MQLSQIDTLQENVLLQIGLENSVQECEVEIPELVFCLSSTHPTIGEMALGDVGRKLVEFVYKIDLTHPDLPHVLDEIFSNDVQFRQQVSEVLELVDRCKHLSTLTSHFHKLIDRSKFSQAFEASPNFAIRLLKSKKDREEIRTQKLIQTVDLKTLYKMGSEIWNRQPSNFEVFNRHNIPYIFEIEESEKKVARYSDLGCEDMGDKITKEIRRLRINLSQRYYGFNRVTMTVASIILAKLHGYKFKTKWDIHDNKIVSVAISPTSLYDFQSHDLSFSGDYNYEPRVYPIHEMKHIASDDMVRVIEHFDNCPDIGGKALFDNFVLLVPGVSLPVIHDGKYSIKDKSGKIVNFDNREKAFKFLDTTLIKENSIQPVLFGERDGKCYFLCYWR